MKIGCVVVVGTNVLTSLKPTSLLVISENIPAELIAHHHWLLWCREPSERGKKKLAQGFPLDEPQDWTKKPYSPDGFLASTTNPDTWSDFGDCLKKYQGSEGFDGLGFVLSRDEVYGDPFFAIDLDHCRDDLDGLIEPWAVKIIQEFNTYIEISPSGDGLHIFGKGHVPGKRHKAGNIEAYDDKRFMTVTGHAIGEL